MFHKFRRVLHFFVPYKITPFNPVVVSSPLRNIFLSNMFSSKVSATAAHKESVPPTSSATLELADPTLLLTSSFIHNESNSVQTAQQLEVLNPYNHVVITRLTQASTSDISRAILSADTAQNAWSDSSLAERSSLLRKWHQLIIHARDDLAHILTLENGKPLADAKAEVDYAASFFVYNSQEALHALHTSAVQAASHQTQVIQQPIGTVLAITPWNFPIAMLARKVAPAIAAGCAVIAKPSELAPLSSLALAELGRRAGLPPGLLNVLVGADSERIVDQVLAAECVRMVTFTGSTVVGKSIAAKATRRVLRVALELGGHAPFVVFDDATLSDAVSGLLANKVRSSGQACISANRIFVQEKIYDQFIELAKTAFQGLVVGNGMEEGVHLGPLISPKAVKQVHGQVKDAMAKGAHRVLGGEPSGNLYPATLLVNVTDEMECCKVETFGPVVPVLKFKSESEVWDRCNHGESGLAAYIYTSNLGRAMRGIRILKYGMVGVNSTAITGAGTTFGGTRQSGLGREGGLGSIHEFLESKFTVLHFDSKKEE